MIRQHRWSFLPSTWLLLPLLLLSSIVTANQHQQQQQQHVFGRLRHRLATPPVVFEDLIVTGSSVTVGGFVDTQKCYSDLNNADRNHNGVVDAEEYVFFVQNEQPVTFDHVTAFVNLPLSLQASFSTLACFCKDYGGSAGCCLGTNAGINTTGTQLGQHPTSSELSYLFQVCVLTESSIKDYLKMITPTAAPTKLSTTAPSLAPIPITARPTRQRPTVTPTSAATPAPTSSPTIHTPAPTVAPTLAPVTVAPTLAPVTAAPTNVPSAATNAPTTSAPTTHNATPAPTAVTPAPTPATSTAKPTTTLAKTPAPTLGNLPTTAPVAGPTAPPTGPRLAAVTNYTIAVKNGKVQVVQKSNYSSDLIKAMDELAVSVGFQVFTNTKKNRLLRQRMLQAKVSTPTNITNIASSTCPSGVSPNDACQTVTASVPLVYSNTNNQTEITKQYLNALNAAINGGSLEIFLEQINPNTVVRILPAITPSGAPTSSPYVPNASKSLSPGATAGIVVGSAAIVLVSLAIWALRRRQTQQKEDDLYQPMGISSATEIAAERDAAAGGTSIGGSTDAAVASTGPATLGAKQADYGKNKGKTSVVAYDTLEAGAAATAAAKAGEPETVDEHESSSNAGSSGWSSSAGVSSLNSGSNDDSVDATGERGEGGAAAGLAAGGATLAAIGAASAIPRVVDKSEAGSVPSMPSVTRADLDTAIEAGDWAAVGATAALLAAASDSQSFSSRSQKSGTSDSRESTAIPSIDAARAAELDHLVDAGDWEGVVLAAAKFEAAEGGTGDSVRSGNTGTKESGSSAGSGTGSGTGSGHSPSTSVSESPSKTQKRAEIRAEVEALVRRVVPEEIDNVDEMMLQFKGREEELVETLRTMQERAVAQKARAQLQKAAKIEARKLVQQQRVPGTPGSGEGTSTSSASAGLGPPAALGLGAMGAAAVGAAAASRGNKKEDDFSEPQFAARQGEPGLVDESSKGAVSEEGFESDGSAKRRRTALEMAIEAGDWEAVGEAAAMMSDNSASVSSADVHNIAAGNYSSDDGTPIRSGVHTGRAAELDDMIDRGDWAGVVAAASRYSQADAPPSAASADSSGAAAAAAAPKRSWFGRKTTGSPTSGDKDPDAERDKQIREEQDALAQAEIWMAIAEQSKTEGATDVGASDAADWAIARSLSALRQAEQKGDLKDKKPHTEESHQEEEDDESV